MSTDGGVVVVVANHSNFIFQAFLLSLNEYILNLKQRALGEFSSIELHHSGAI